jgi:hypothetical protein
MGDETEDNIERAINFAIENAADDPAFLADAAEEEEVVDDETAQAIPKETVSAGDTTDTGSNEAVGGGSSNDGAVQPKTPEAPAEIVPSNKAIANERGDFVDENGKVLARAGSERRMYERLQRSERSAKHFESEVGRLQQEATQSRTLNDLPKQYNLNESEVGLGLHIINQLKTSPVEAGRWILQEVMKSGYNLQQILGDVEGVPSSSMDMGAISRLIDEKLSPITQNHQQQESATHAATENQRNAEQFIATHDYADVHLDAIVNLMKQNPQMGTERAYFEVRQYAQANGLDFTQPLGQQIEARRNAAPNVPPVVNQPNREMPNGNATSTTETQQPEEISADDDWDHIIKQSMSEAGMPQ